jgi:hypothetical protein
MDEQRDEQKGQEDEAEVEAHRKSRGLNEEPADDKGTSHDEDDEVEAHMKRRG